MRERERKRERKDDRSNLSCIWEEVKCVGRGEGRKEKGKQEKEIQRKHYQTY